MRLENEMEKQQHELLTLRASLRRDEEELKRSQEQQKLLADQKRDLLAQMQQQQALAEQRDVELRRLEAQQLHHEREKAVLVKERNIMSAMLDAQASQIKQHTVEKIQLIEKNAPASV